jgi:ATP-binding cassette, subfamily C (CFTR/MRP), member 1
MSVCLSNSTRIVLIAAANIPFVFTPAATFAVYVVQAYIRGSNSLDTIKAFTSLALITLVSYPASRVLSAVPNTARSIGSFDRIQEFLLRCEEHQVVAPNKNSIHQGSRNGYVSSNQVSTLDQSFIVSCKDTDIGFSNVDISESNKVVLSNVNLNIPKSSITMVIGAVGSGKTTLVRTIMGELPCLRGQMDVIASRIGYCSQTAWIPYGTVRHIITGKGDDENIEEDWYNEVVRGCALLPDITSLSNYDKTIVGSRGVTLSGGQKQRLALARAVYNRPPLLLLDDVFSPLDKNTQALVFDRLIGENGLVKKFDGTTILVTKNSEYIDHHTS